MSVPVDSRAETDQRSHPVVLVVVCTALFFGVVNPVHNGSGAPFSNAFAALLVPTAIGLVLSAALPRRRPTGDKADS